ncbi:PTS mannose/fructose/sorbose/N-acetylgalactosamine transporter subunit IIC [Proteiniclasticum ruminis]|uniref:PTS system, mannose-specific IIC component n=1 Tax=Proteiniclasticum ruminis TaxID=398199 RepID=A0A1I5A2H7_9CLOT|nr:PTS sugar transporter subunit IIC [Proteiniclasticum ruminis]SFN56449.1 PTS system, mannose-specific IIC component [Proteiniclasticum ruminis]
MFINTLLIIAVAFFAYMHSYMGSTMHNRPIIVAPLVGLVLGDLTTGILVGATLELVFMGAFPIGASNPPDFVSGTIIATGFIIMSGQEIAAAVALAVPIATLVLLFDNFLMTVVLIQAAHIADKYAEKGDIESVEKIQRIAGIGNKVILALVVGLGFYVGVPLIEKILAFIPDFVIHGMDVAAGILPAIGFAMLARMMINKELFPFLLLGFLLSAYLNIPILGIGLFGLCIALYYVNQNQSKQEVAADENEF